MGWNDRWVQPLPSIVGHARGLGGLAAEVLAGVRLRLPVSSLAQH